MPTKKKTKTDDATKAGVMPICYICNKEISGDHVYIKTKRRTELHIHFECMKGDQDHEG